jgi:hypothetical protein
MSTDPGLSPEAWKHDQLTTCEMQDIAAAGCGVVHVRAVEYAAQHGVELAVRSSFHQNPGTSIQPTVPDQCAQEQASVRESRYRPLTMSLDEGLWRLTLNADDPVQGDKWRDSVLEVLDTPCIVAEWMDSGQGFRWEILAPEAVLAPVVDSIDAPIPGPAAKLEKEITCLSFAGGQPDSWLEVQRHLTELLVDLGCKNWRLRADGTALRVLFQGRVDPELPDRLHRFLLPS